MAVLWLGRLAGAGTFVPRFLDSNDQHRVVQVLAALGGIEYRGSIRGYFDEPRAEGGGKGEPRFRTGGNSSCRCYPTRRPRPSPL